MKQAIQATDYKFPGQTGFYQGKVRDVYYFEDKIAVVASDRISAFDFILPKPIPCKGQVLNQIAYEFLSLTRDIAPNWMLSSPDPNVTIGWKCEPFPVEMVIRGYLSGHAWREYRDGKRTLCGVPLPEGLKESDKLPEPIITPATKAVEGHDEDISREDIIARGLVSASDYEVIENYTRQLFAFGSQKAQERGLLLVDTKYEFGKRGDQIYLIDEVHTPDSSRYFYAEGYEARQAVGESQKQLSKEFVRQWLIANGFQGKEGQAMPDMPEEMVQTISQRYIELYEKLTGKTFVSHDNENIIDRIYQNIKSNL